MHRIRRKTGVDPFLASLPTSTAETPYCLTGSPGLLVHLPCCVNSDEFIATDTRLHVLKMCECAATNLSTSRFLGDMTRLYKDVRMSLIMGLGEFLVLVMLVSHGIGEWPAPRTPMAEERCTDYRMCPSLSTSSCCECQFDER